MVTKTSPFAGGASLRLRTRPALDRGCRAAVIAAALAGALALGPTPRAEAGPELTIGNVNTFKTSSSGTNPAGTWTLGDKDYTYVGSSPISTGTGAPSTWRGFEQIKILENANPSLFSHQFLIDTLSDYRTGESLFLGYRVKINGNDGPRTFANVSLSQIFSTQTVEVWKDVFTTEAQYNANPGVNNGTAAKLYFNSSSGTVPLAATLPAGLTELWVRDTFLLSSPGGSISSLNNTFVQTNVPEIDAGSIASALAMVAGALGLLERRVRATWGLRLGV